MENLPGGGSAHGNSRTSGLNVADRVVVITGASSGIGAALAEELGHRGDAVVLAARREARLREVAAKSGGKALVVVADVSKRDEVRRLVAAALERFGRIDIWVNNAGQGITRLPSQLTDEDIDEMMTVNVKSVLYGMQEVLPHFQSRNAGQIINISSMLGRMPVALHRAAYTAAKHYLNALTANFRDELRDRYPGIQVTLVSPGVVETEFIANALHGGPGSGMSDAQSPGEVARVIAEVMDSRRPDVYTKAGASARVVKYYEVNGSDP